MPLKVTSEVPLDDIVALWTGGASSGTVKPMQHRAAILQAARSLCVGFYVESRLVAAALFYPAGDRHELVFACLPEIVRHLPSLIHTARLTLARFAQSEGMRISARVRVGHEPGRRLARLSGFHLAGRVAGYERWEWSGGEIRGRPENPVHRGPGSRHLGAGSGTGAPA